MALRRAARAGLSLPWLISPRGCCPPARWSRVAAAERGRGEGDGDRRLLSTERRPGTPAALAIGTLLPIPSCRDMSFLPDLGALTMEKATLEFLEEIELKTLGPEKRTFKAGELWKENGAVIMAVRRPG
uniref:Redox-regulatory protein FAM213A n=1 Tax=Cyanoderma ruficeps TaxID=181631 RepID=A0A8C3NYA6_9PASS